jgi:phosphopantetheinyl transferase (holo-ACP synthase)
MIRLSDADRADLRDLAAPPAAVAAEPDAEPAMPVGDARERVMADYFEMMRGFLDHQRAWVERLPQEGAAPASEPPAVSPCSSTHVRDSYTPLLDSIVEHDEHHVLARCRVGLLTDAFIRDHVMSGPVSDTDPALFGLSCVPFTVSLEIMAEACALLVGRRDVRVIENVRAFDWVALDDGELEFEVRAELIDRAQGHCAARVITARGPVLTAEFRFDAEWQIGPVAELAERRESFLNAPHLYATGMFHGPVFQSMRYVHAWDDSGIDVELTEVSLDGFFAPGSRPQLVLNPVLLDAMGQVVACWLVQYVGTDFHAFPSTIDRIELLEACPADRHGVMLRMRQHPVDPAATDIQAPRAWQFDCVDGDGRVLMRGRDLVNLFFTVPKAYHAVRMDPLQGRFGQPLPAAPQTPALLWEVPMMSEEFCAQSGAICLRILAHAVLDAGERQEWRALQGPPRKRREWLFGRAALKEAVREWVQARTGHLLFPSDVVVDHDERGAPRVSGWWTESQAAAPQVSLTHTADTCIVAVADPGPRVGVDLEVLGRVRDPALVARSFAVAEQGLVSGLGGEALEERVLRLWCAKEAAAKCLGTGLQGLPENFAVVGADEAFENIVVAHAAGSFEVLVVRRDHAVLAVAAPLVPQEAQLQ